MVSVAKARVKTQSWWSKINPSMACAGEPWAWFHSKTWLSYSHIVSNIVSKCDSGVPVYMIQEYTKFRSIRRTTELKGGVKESWLVYSSRRHGIVWEWLHKKVSSHIGLRGTIRLWFVVLGQRTMPVLVDRLAPSLAIPFPYLIFSRWKQPCQEQPKLH